MTKKYTDLFPCEDDEQRKDVDAEVIVVGAGIAGASIAYHLAKDAVCRVMVLEQYDYSSQNLPNKDNFAINHGSSRGGPRRIGVLGTADLRVVQAWEAWQELDLECKDDNLMDIAGEVYVFSWFPFGWMFVALFGMYFVYLYVTDKKRFPDGLKLLWTGQAIQAKLGPAQGFKSGCWMGSVGIYYDDSAALHTDKILRYLLTSQQNLDVRYGSKVSNIEMVDDGGIVQVAVNDKNEIANLRCQHVVVAGGGWAGDLLTEFWFGQSQKDKTNDIFDPDSIRTKIEVFTCPVYKVQPPSNGPPPVSLESKCPLFSCVGKKLYGFPINFAQGDATLYIRPFFKGSESANPDDQTLSKEQQDTIDTFVEDCLLNGDDQEEATVSYSHSYTCRYPKLSLDNGKSYKPVFDFVPGSNQRIVLNAGLDGYSFKYGSIFGAEFLELLESKTPPKNCDWPTPEKRDERNIFVRILTMLARNVVNSEATTSKEE